MDFCRFRAQYRFPKFEGSGVKTATVFVLVLAAIAGGSACSRDDAPKAPAPTASNESAAALPSDPAGTLEVKSPAADPSDWFDVLQAGKRAFPGNPPRLNNTLDLPPGTYEVDVNKTRRTVTIAAGEKTELWTGELIVEGQPDSAYWYPMLGEERKLALNPPLLNRSRALFPGSYHVFVHTGVGTPDHDLGSAEVKPGETTVLQFVAPPEGS